MTPRHASGFTLIEVLVAIVILALASLVLANAFGSSAGGFSRLDERSQAWLLASNKLVELQVYQQWPGVGTQDDTVDVAGVDWRVRTRVSNGPYPDTRRVDIEVGAEPEMGQDFYITYSQRSLLGKPYVPPASSGGGGANSAGNGGAGAGGGGGGVSN